MNVKKIGHFNIRVYGLFIRETDIPGAMQKKPENQPVPERNINLITGRNDNRQILLSDEYVLDQKMTKFPGGGLKFGEGTIDCLKREALEEFRQEIEIVEHFYTTHFFQQAFFYENHQLISIYYLARFPEEPSFRISLKPFDFSNMENGSQSFRWAHLHSLTSTDLTFPIDQYVLGLLQGKHP